ncbi:MAG TPA: hypothetical protein DD490_14930 [Acidobacteria bacterium]|nr:hypothetical protein [Acidobacteriota bacterium]
MKPIRVIPALLALLALAAEAQDCTNCLYTDRGDREEGRVTQWKVSGGSLELLGVHYRSPRGSLKPSDKLHLYFWLPASETPLIEVREPNHNYFMLPKKKTYPAGLQEFAWPRAAAVDPLRLDPASFLSRVSNREETVYYPVFLSSGARPEPGGRYIFLFRSGAGLDVTCTLLRQEAGGLVPIRKFPYVEELGGMLPIEWDGLDDKKQPVPPGRYVLKLRGDMLAETIRPISESYSFEHYGNFN